MLKAPFLSVLVLTLASCAKTPMAMTSEEEDFARVAITQHGCAENLRRPNQVCAMLLMAGPEPVALLVGLRRGVPQIEFRAGPDRIRTVRYAQWIHERENDYRRVDHYVVPRSYDDPFFASLMAQLEPEQSTQDAQNN